VPGPEGPDCCFEIIFCVPAHILFIELPVQISVALIIRCILPEMFFSVVLFLILYIVPDFTQFRITLLMLQNIHPATQTLMNINYFDLSRMNSPPLSAE